ncbi:MAG TPA: hypothetical protein GXZ81_05960 [Fastidiosipila sp.]|jgi:uncharacterized membrane protein YkoI|nr:hypothetical protein [Fastidiosipila sp.]
MVRYEDIRLSPGDALDISYEKYPNARIKEIELELEAGSYVYEVEGYTDEKKFKIYIDSISGNIIQSKEKVLKEKDIEITKESTSNIKEIVNRVLQEAGANSQLQEWSLKTRDGIPVLSIELRLADSQKAKYRYNLTNNELLIE